MGNLPSPGWTPFPLSGTDTGNWSAWLGKPFQGAGGNTYVMVKAGTGIVTASLGKAVFMTLTGADSVPNWTVNISGTLTENQVGWIQGCHTGAIASGTYFMVLRNGYHTGIYTIATGALAAGNGLYYVSSGAVASVTDNITGTLTGADFMSGFANTVGYATSSATVLTGGGYVGAVVQAKFGGGWG